MGLLTREERQQLVELLLQLPGVLDADARRLLVIDLPYNLQAGIPVSDVPAQHVAHIVATVESQAWAPLSDGTWPVLVVVENALYTMEGSQLAGSLQTLLDLLKARATQAASSARQPAQAPARLSATTTPAPPVAATDAEAPGGPAPAPPAPPVALSKNERLVLQQALLKAFPSRGALAQVTAQGLGARLEDISPSGSLPGMILDVIEWAEAEGRMGDLIAGAAAASPTSPALTALARQHEPGATTEDALVDTFAAAEGPAGPPALGGALRLLLSGTGLPGDPARLGGSLRAPLVRRLDGAERRRLHSALQKAFPKKGRLAQMVWDTFDENLPALAGSADLPVTIFNLITWAEETGHLSALVQAAADAMPDDPTLRTLGAPELTPAQLQQIQNALRAAFPDREALATVARAGLDVQLPVVAGAGDLAAVIYNLTMWAESQHRIVDLIAAALAARPDSTDLRAVGEQLGLDPAGLQAFQARRASGNPLRPADQERLIGLIGRLPAFAADQARERQLFLARAGLPEAWVHSRDWTGPAPAAATQLVTATAAQRVPFRDGYTMLGAVLDRLLRESGVGRDDALFIAETILRYRLIDLTRTAPSEVLQDLLRAL